MRWSRPTGSGHQNALDQDGYSLGGGRKPLRDALYMPALVAMRFNPDLKAKYTALREAGKPAKVAIVALMRKLLETANALVKADRLWVPKCSCA